MRLQIQWALRELWSRYAGPLVGVRTGHSSGIDVLDLDRKHREATVWWTSHRDRLPANPRASHPLRRTSSLLPTCTRHPVLRRSDRTGDRCPRRRRLFHLVAGRGAAGAEQCAVRPLAGLVACPAITITTDRGLTHYGAGRPCS